MNVAQIFAALEYDTGELPREALEQAIRNKEALTPKLIDCIINARNHPEIIQQKDRFYMGHIHAMYLLAQFREKAAYAPIVDLFASLPADVIDEPVGDIITEDLHRILPSVSGGDDALIRTLIEQETASPYVRAAAVQSFITMIVAGFKSREQVIDYYSQLFKGGLKRKASLTWDELVSCTTDLRARELLEEIQRAYDEDLFGEDYISINEIKNGMKKSADTALKYLSMNRAYSLINDTIKDMKRFEFYRDINEDEDLDSDDDPIPDLKPVRTTPKTGRNDPCPCGSGKKYKKCCGKNV